MQHFELLHSSIIVCDLAMYIDYHVHKYLDFLPICIFNVLKIQLKNCTKSNHDSLQTKCSWFLLPPDEFEAKDDRVIGKDASPQYLGTLGKTQQYYYLKIPR